MSDFQLQPGTYGAVSPSGAYLAVSQSKTNPARRLLLRLMAEETAPLLSPGDLARWTGLEEKDALELLHRLQSLGLVEGHTTPPAAPEGPLEQVLPLVLAPLSGSGKALLADSQGFYLATVGFPHETAEELSALSAGLAELYGRYHGLLHNNVGIPTGNWGLVDAAGNSEIGFWPLHIGKQRFTLVLAGLPQLNHTAFVDLVWSLARRYAGES